MKLPSRFLMSVILLVASPSAFAGEGGDGVGNGAGLAEKNIAFAWSNLPKYVDFCLRSESCRLSPIEKGMLGKISQALPEEMKSQKPVEFLSEKEKPGFFLLDGQVRIARTGNRVGDVIHFNRDLLYSTLPSGKIEGLSVPAATALLIHELGHHQGFHDHTALDLLGAKVQNLLHGFSQTVNTWPWYDNLWASTIRFETTDAYSQFLVWDDTQLLDLTAQIAAKLRCPSLHGPAAPYGAAFLGLRWESPYTPISDGISRMAFRFSTLTYCRNERRQESMGESDVKITVALKVALPYSLPPYRVSTSPSLAAQIQPELTKIEVLNHGHGENCRTTNCQMPEN